MATAAADFVLKKTKYIYNMRRVHKSQNYYYNNVVLDYDCAGILQLQHRRMFRGRRMKGRVKCFFNFDRQLL